MWTRKELKTKAKLSLKVNYWKAVFVAFIAISVGVGSGGMSSAAGSASGLVSSSNQTVDTATYTDYTGYEDYLNEYAELEDYDADEAEALVERINQMSDKEASQRSQELGGVLVVLAAIIIPLMMLAIAVVVALNVFVLNPLEVGETVLPVRPQQKGGDQGDCLWVRPQLP